MFLPDISDDEGLQCFSLKNYSNIPDQKQLTKLNKPAGLQIIRRAPAGEKVDDATEENEPPVQKAAPQKVDVLLVSLIRIISG